MLQRSASILCKICFQKKNSTTACVFRIFNYLWYKLEFGVFIIFIASGPSENDKLYSDLNETEYNYDYGINIGYRYQKKQGGLFFKAYLLKFRGDDGYSHVTGNYSYSLPWIGIGVGHTFK